MTKKTFELEEMLEIVTSVIEAAVHNQETVNELIGKLRGAIGTLEEETEELPRAVSNRVGQEFHSAVDKAADRIVEKFVAANRTAVQATSAYEKSMKSGPMQIIFFALGGLALLGITIVASAVYYVKSMDVIRQKQLERDDLISQIQNFHNLSRIDYTYCGQSLCVKIDKRLKTNGKGYYVVVMKD